MTNDSEQTSRTSFAPPWAFAALLPWFVLSLVRTLRGDGVGGDLVLATISGTLIGVLLLGAGLPYLVYRITKRSQRAALCTMISIGAIGLLGQAVPFVLGTGQSLAVVTSPDIARVIESGETQRSSEFGKVLTDAMRNTESKLSGDALVQTKALHASMRDYWIISNELNKAAMAGSPLAAKLKSDSKLAGTDMESLRSDWIYFKDAVFRCEQIIKLIDGEQARAERSMSEDGYPDRRAVSIARQIGSMTHRDVRRDLAEADRDRWTALMGISGTYWPPAQREAGRLKDDNGRWLEPVEERKLRLEDLAIANERVTRALQQLENG